MTVLESLQKSGVGLLIVFIGLIFLIAIVSLMGAICKRLIHEKPAKSAPVQVPTQATAAAPANNEIADRDALVAVLSAAVAEELGVGVDAIRVVSLKQIN